MKQKTEIYGFVICPICEKVGQLKLRRGKYYYVDHYKGKIELKDDKFKGSKFRAKYLYSCYIGKDLPRNIQYIRRQL